MRALGIFLAAILAATSAGADVNRGDTVEQVRATLGAPRGELSRGDIVVFVYDRGEVEFRQGVVHRVLLRTPVQQEEYLRLAAEQDERARQENETRRARSVADGEALKARKLADPNFLSSPVAVQLSFWQDFARAYPDVRVDDLVLSAHSRRVAELAVDEERRKQRELIAQLEQRLTEVETRAAAGPEIVAPISYPYYPIYRRRHPRHRYEPDYPVNFFPMQYPNHIGLGSPRPPEPPTPPVIGYDPLLRR
jgi:hypothetical protein